MEASKRQPCPVRNRKDPISREILISLCDKFKDCNDVIHVRDISIILLSFAVFFRFKEVSALKLEDVKFKDMIFRILSWLKNSSRLEKVAGTRERYFV